MRELLVNNAVIISPSYTRSNSTDETYCVKGDTPILGNIHQLQAQLLQELKLKQVQDVSLPYIPKEK